MKFLLVGRSQADLEGVAQDVRECYGTTTHVHILLADLAKNDPDTAYQLYSKIRNTHGIRVRVAIFNAGTMGRVQNHYDLSNENHNQQLLPMMALNIQSTTLLSSLVASDMMDHEGDDAGRRGRIMFVASIVGTAPGLPGSAVYGATKAYIRSLSHGLRDELRLSDKKNSISVSCLLPGATTGTDFAARGQLESAAVWNYPFSVSTAETVARHAIDGMMRGDAEIFPGTPLNTIMAKVAIPLLPPSLSTWFMGFSWRPWPFSFPPKWRPSHLVSAKQYEERSTDGTKSETNANAKTCTKEYEEIPFVVHID
jgi:short-subunit dehydrogenase